METPREALPNNLMGEVFKGFLTWREWLGYSFEVENYHCIVSFLTDSYQLTTNPLNPYQWKHTVSKGHDKSLCIYKCRFYIEEKYVSVRQYPSWIKRHYIPRFERCREGYKIVLVNDTSKFNDKCIQTLSRHNIMLMDIHQFTDFLYMIRCFYKGTKNLYKSCSNQCSHVYKISHVSSTHDKIINFQGSEAINNTETASALDQETNHSINLSTKGKSIIQIFREEVNVLESQGERNEPKIEQSSIFYLKDYTVFFGFTDWEFFQLTNKRGYKIKKGKNQKKQFDEALIRLFITRSMERYKIQKEINQLHKKRKTVGLNSEEKQKLDRLKKERKHKDMATSPLYEHVERRHFLLVAEDGRIRAIFKKKIGCRVLTPEDLRVYEHELNPKEITLEEMFDILFSYHYFHPFAESNRNPSYIELNTLRKYIKEFYGKHHKVTFEEWREWLRRGKLPRETRYHNQSVYGFRCDLDYYLNFNRDYGEIENNKRDNMEMVSLCNNEVMKDEG